MLDFHQEAYLNGELYLKPFNNGETEQERKNEADENNRTDCRSIARIGCNWQNSFGIRGNQPQ